VLAVLIVGIAAIVHAQLQPSGSTNVGFGTSGSAGGNPSGNTSSGGTPSSGYSSSTAAPPPPPPAQVGIVQFDQVQDNSESMSVAQMFSNYFSGINDHKYQRSIDVFDPSSPAINPNDPSSEPKFAAADQTSHDTDVAITNLDPADGSTVTSAEVTFQSKQAPGYGPADAPDETCTQWDITYQLTTSPSGDYQIYNVTSDIDSPC
jgi:eukaryotic-like serine/threonine-protein kinase